MIMKQGCFRIYRLPVLTVLPLLEPLLEEEELLPEYEELLERLLDLLGV